MRFQSVPTLERSIQIDESTVPGSTLIEYDSRWQEDDAEHESHHRELAEVAGYRMKRAIWG